MFAFLIKQIYEFGAKLFRTLSRRLNPPRARVLVGYCPVWGAPLGKRLFALQGVNAVNLAFGFPEYDNTVGWGPQQAPDQKSVVAAVAALRARKIPVLISLGGENCTRNDWENITDHAAFAASVRAFVDEWGLSGVDLDYQVHDKDHSGAIPIVRALRETLPRGQYLLTYSGWPQVDISEQVLKEAGEYLDWVNACCYVINTTPEYNPREMIERYVDLVGDEKRVIFGFRVQRRPGEPIMSLDQGLDFTRYVMERDLGGVMLWNLSDERTGEFIDAIVPLLFPEGAPRTLNMRRLRG